MGRVGAELDTIRRVRAATILHAFEAPVHLAGRILRHREFVLVRIDAESRLSGFAYCLTRDGPVAAIVDRTNSPTYVGRPVADPEGSFDRALLANNAAHRSGVGLRGSCLSSTSPRGTSRRRRPA